MIKQRLIPLVFPFVLVFFTFKFIQIIAPYTTWERDVDFLVTKQHIIHRLYYRAAFYAHIFSSPLVLLSGAFLFSKQVLQRWPGLHRAAGRVYVLLLLIVSAPSGLVMGFYANGGWAAQASFFVLTPLWWWFTWMGYKAVCNRRFATHRDWMWRSYALTLSAVSLRIYQLVLGSLAEFDPVAQYVFVSWAAWLGNWALAEWLILVKNRQGINPVLSFFALRRRLPHPTANDGQ